MRQTRNLSLVGALVVAAAGSLPSQQKVTLSKPAAETSESFTLITSISELPSGKVLVSDMRDKVVQLVDLASGSMTKVGREGQGPGEYGLPRGLFGMPNGETLLYDMTGRRFLSISADGKPGAIVETPRPPATTGGGGPVIMGLGDFRGVDARGRIYYQAPGFSPNGMLDSVPIMRWDRGTSRIDTVAYVKTPPGSFANRQGNNFTVRVGGGKVWAPSETWSVTGDGRIARLVPSPYQVIWYVDGKASKGPVQPYAPIKVTKAEKDAYLEALRRSPPTMITIGGGAGGNTRTQTNTGPGPAGQEPEFEETMPPFGTGAGGGGGNAVLGTPDGEVWVLRTRPASDKTPTYDVFDRTGALVKKVSLNPSSRVVGFGKGVVYVARSDEDDLQYLQRFARP